MDETGEMIGIVGLSEALRRAEDAGLDLIEISPQAVPSVCKILDNGKYKYEQQKKKMKPRKSKKSLKSKR